MSTLVQSNNQNGIPTGTVAVPQPESVIIVDDERDLLTVLEESLSRKYRCQTAGTVTELNELLKAGFPDLIVIDLKLENDNGVEVISQLRERGYIGAAILMTGRLDKSSALKAVNNGFQRILEKPFDLADLAKVVHGTLEETRLSRLRSVVQKRVGQLTEIYWCMRLALTDKVPDLDAVIDKALSGAGFDGSYVDVVQDLENEIDRLIGSSRR